MVELTKEEWDVIEREAYKRTIEERYGELPEKYLCRHCDREEFLVQLTPVVAFYVHKCAWVDKEIPNMRGRWAFRRVCGFCDWDAEKGTHKIDLSEYVE